MRALIFWDVSRRSVRVTVHSLVNTITTAKAFNGNPTLYRRVFARYVAVHYWSEGKFDYDAMDLMVEGLQIVGKQKGPVDWSKMVDFSFLPTDLQN